MWHGENCRVTLLDDLTRYHGHLKPGSKGTILQGVKASIWGSEDRFCAARFDCCGHTIDVLLKGLEIEGVAEEAAAREAKFKEELRTTTEAVLQVGPHGGFRSLTVRYAGGTRSMGSGFKGEAEKVMAILKEYGIPVKKERVL